MSERSDAPILFSGTSTEGSVKNIISEHRSQVRFPFTASAEVYNVRSRTRVNGRCSDLGAGGCYVDTLSPFAVGAQVTIGIDRDNRRFEAEAVVAYAHVQMGMGLTFTAVKPEHLDVLHSWIAGLSGDQHIDPPEPIAKPEARDVEGDASTRFVLNELITLLVRKRIITENEATALLREMFR
jgi:hypothetical protein